LQSPAVTCETVLGFKGNSNFPNFVTLTRGDVDIMFIVPQDDPEDGKDPSSSNNFFPKSQLTGSIFIFMEQVDKLWESVKDKVIIKSGIADRAYWMRDFSILDNNGYEIVFGQDISRSVE
jgi:hypothetical protein